MRPNPLNCSTFSFVYEVLVGFHMILVGWFVLERITKESENEAPVKGGEVDKTAYIIKLFVDN